LQMKRHFLRIEWWAEVEIVDTLSEDKEKVSQ
jgi:hypothetical protein